MDKTTLIKYLDILSKAETGHKLAKATGEWYLSSGWMSGLYRTLSGESRKDVLELMDKIVNGLAEFQDIVDIQARNEIVLAIGPALAGCDKIMETYRGDEKFMEEFVFRMHKIAAFKEPKVKNITVPTERIKLRDYQSIAPSIFKNRRVGVDYINTLIKPETIDNKDSRKQMH